MKKIPVLFLAGLLLCISSGALAFDSFLIQNPKEIAPGFVFYTLEGQVVNSDELKGRLILLFFWNSTCKPCIAEIPELEKLYEKYKDSPDVSMHLVNSGYEPLEKAKNFLEKKRYRSRMSGSKESRINLPYAYDLNSKNFKLFNLFAHPSVVIVDQKFRVRMKHTGYTKNLFAKFNQHIQDLLSEK